MKVPRLADYDKTMAKLVSKGPGKEMSTTMGFVRLLSDLLRDKKIGKHIVPIVPDESRTFGMEGLFRQVGIYSHVGQLYEPVDSDQLAFYKEAKDGQLLEEGITEAGSMSSFIAAGTAYSSHGVNMIPMFIYYSMFGFQRIGDLIWAAADARAKGFMLGGTAGRTTLNGEGLQHQDGHSLLNAIAFPTVRAYDPAYAYETAVIIFDGLKRLYEDNETAIYYITLRERELRDARDAGRLRRRHHPRHVPRVDRQRRRRSSACSCSAAARSCAKRCGRSTSWPRSTTSRSDVWSVTSYTQLRRDAQECERLEHAQSRRSRARALVRRAACWPAPKGPFIAASRLRARAGRADQPLGARRAVRAGHRRHGPQRKPRGPAPPLRSRRRVHHARRALPTQEARQVRRPVRRQRRERTGHRSRKNNRRCTHKRIQLNHEDTKSTKQNVNSRNDAIAT